LKRLLSKKTIPSEKWAALLANASSGFRQVRPAFVEVLKELTPEEAILLDMIYDNSGPGTTALPGKHLVNLLMLERVLFGHGNRTPESSSQDEQLLLLNDDLTRLGILSRQERNTITVNDPRRSMLPIFDFYLTPFGHAFISACRAPDPI
jgi:hypothetical protein